MTFTNKNFVDGNWTTPNVQTFEDFELELELNNGIFRRKLSQNSKFGKSQEACSGTYIIINEQFKAWGDGCPCWCDCAPNIDCGGDLILRDYDILEMSDQQLLLSAINIRDYGIGNQRYNEIIIDLERI